MPKCLYVKKVSTFMVKNQRLVDRAFIIARILQSGKTERGSPEGKIMSDALIDLEQIDLYLRNMIANSLIQYNPVTRTYKTTKNGDEFLKTITQMVESLSLLKNNDVF